MHTVLINDSRLEIRDAHRQALAWRPAISKSSDTRAFPSAYQMSSFTPMAAELHCREKNVRQIKEIPTEISSDILTR